MIRAILYKELRQHWWAFLLIGLICTLGFFGQLASSSIRGSGGSAFSLLSGFGIYIALASLILANRLVASEYHSQTQLFLEALPLPRKRIILLKYFLGLTVIAIIAVFAFATTLLIGFRTEALSQDFILFLTLRFGAFCYFTYSFFFLYGFLGRYRLVFFIALFFLSTAFPKITDFEFSDLPPIELIGPTFAFERENFPLKPFIISIGLAFSFLLMSLSLATLREGSLAGLLGEKMSHREKVSIAALLMAFIFSAYWLDESKPKEAYQMHNASSAGSLAEGGQVSVSPASPEGQVLADKINAEMKALSLYLGIKSLAPVFVIRRNDLDPDINEAGYLADNEGIVIRTNFTHPEWSFDHFNENLIARLLDVYSNDRLRKEDRFWVIDGFTLFWSRRHQFTTATGSKELTSPPGLLLRALYGTRDRPPFTPASMRQWFALQDELGHEITAGIACSTLRVLESTVGPDKCQAFLRSVLSVESPKGVATSLRDLFSPPEKLFLEHTGLEFSDFLPRWQNELEQVRPAYQQQVNALPEISGKLLFEALSPDSFQARYSLLEPGEVSIKQKAQLRYASLQPFASQVPEHLLIPVPLGLTTASRSGVLPDDFPRGTRLVYTFSVYSKELNCLIISGWQRKEAL